MSDIQIYGSYEHGITGKGETGINAEPAELSIRPALSPGLDPDLDIVDA